MRPETVNLRAAIGIFSDKFELSEGEYYELYKFDPPPDWEGFKHNCEQVQAKWPTHGLFQQLENRWDKELDED